MIGRIVKDKIFHIVCNVYNNHLTKDNISPTVLPAKSDSDVMFCLQSYQGFICTSDLSIRISSSEVYTLVFN